MRSMTEEDEVTAVADRLQREFSDVAPTVDDVRDLVRVVRERYRDARVLQFVPLLVYRDTRETLSRFRETGSHPRSGQ